jgi:hypothetical protein
LASAFFRVACQPSLVLDTEEKFMFPYKVRIVFLLSLFALVPVAVSQTAPSTSSAPSQKPPCKYDLNGIIVGDASACTPNTNPSKLSPNGTLLVKGAWSSASDSTTPVPESGKITNGAYSNQYFVLSYPVSSDWYQKFEGPPPSDSGLYVLAQLRPSETFKGPAKGLILITAQDLFFTPTNAVSALELINFTKDHLRDGQQPEHQPAEVKIAGRAFTRFDYLSPAIPLHTYVVATEIRCHAVEFVFSSREPALLESLIQEMSKMKLPAATPATGGEGPVCIKDYATGNLIQKVEPVFTERRFNAVPVRIIISKEGKVKHIHFLSAFPDQSKTITDALMQWQFKPYLRDGKPVEVETGILFGNTPAPRPASPVAPQARHGSSAMN